MKFAERVWAGYGYEYHSSQDLRNSCGSFAENYGDLRRRRILAINALKSDKIQAREIPYLLSETILRSGHAADAEVPGKQLRQRCSGY